MPPRKSDKSAALAEPDADLAAAGSDDEPSIVQEAAPGALESAVEDLGTAVIAQQQDEQGTADAEGQHAGALSAIDNITEQMNLDSDALVYDVRDELLEIIKHRPKPWSATSQAEQRDVASRIEEFGRKLIRQIVEAVASRGATPVRALLTKVTLGGDIVIAGKVKTYDPEEENRAVDTLHKAIGKHVLLTVASVDDYAGQGRDADIDEDQPGFGFEAGSDDEPE